MSDSALMAMTLGRVYGEKTSGAKLNAIAFNLLINARRGVKPSVRGSSYQQSAMNYVGMQSVSLRGEFR